jgi:hypothetical protein
LNIQIDLAKKNHLTIELWDMQGKKIITRCKNEFYTVRNHLIKYSSNRNLPTGMYLLKIQAKNATTNYTKLISE